ncbi:hypothetical protein [Sphingomonas sp.]|uniref:hypothetical protein n=1 Tax=Sphingomonas sp. TaxID=28214 RepID=UPI000DB453FF|nr:hypothetical protein [Sphingomonas sp.]PZU11433.1 MAG: hypothetical protein DI605_00040 [Sphingomonas sp.]
MSPPKAELLKRDEQESGDPASCRPRSARCEAINQRLLAERRADTLECERVAISNAVRIAHLVIALKNGVADPELLAERIRRG